MKLLSIFLFAVLFIFQVILGMNFGSAEIRRHELPSTFGGSRGHGGPPPPGGAPSGSPPDGPPPPPPTNATSRR